MGKPVSDEEQAYGPWMIVKKKNLEVKPGAARDTRPKGDGPRTAVNSEDQRSRAQHTDYSYVSYRSRETSDGKRK